MSSVFPRVPRTRWSTRLNEASGFARGLWGLWVPVGASMIDISRYRNHANSITGAPVPTPASRGLGIQFSASDALYGGGSALWSGFAVTFAAWVRFAASPVADGMLFYRDKGTGSRDFFAGMDGWGGTSRRLYVTPDGSTQHRSSVTVGADEWHLWMYTNNGSSGGMYLDGQLVTAFGGMDGINASGPVHINGVVGSNAGNHAVGPIYVWGREFGASEALAFYASELSIYAPIERRIWVGAAAPSIPSIAAIYADSVTAGSVSPRITLSYP